MTQQYSDFNMNRTSVSGLNLRSGSYNRRKCTDLREHTYTKIHLTTVIINKAIRCCLFGLMSFFIVHSLSEKANTIPCHISLGKLSSKMLNTIRAVCILL